MRPVVFRAPRRARCGGGFRRAFGGVGAVDALASLFALFDRPKEQVARVPGTIVAGLRLLEALIDARAPTRGANSRIRARATASSGVERIAVVHASSSASASSADGESPAGSLIAALEATALAGLPTLLTSVLLHTEAELRAPVLQDPGKRGASVAADFVPVAATVLRLLNATARFGPETTQRALSSTDLRVETHHLLSFVLALCASEWESAAEAAGSAERRPRRPGSANARAEGSANAGATAAELADLLDQTVLFIGAFALLCPANQDMLCWGRAPTLTSSATGSALRVLQLPREDRDAVPHARRGGVSTRDQSRTHRRGTESRDGARVHRQERAARERGEGVVRPRARRRLPPLREFARARFPPAMWADAEAYFDPKV